jgi:viroplasmin and RNaseH domain-containing protein
MTNWPFKVTDCWGDAHGDFNSLESAREWIKHDIDSVTPDTTHYKIWQFVEEHNAPETDDD